MQRFLFSLVAWLVTSFSASAEPLPTKRGIFVAPGGFVPPSAYEALVEKVTSRLSGATEVFYATFLGGFPTSNATNRQLEEFYKAIERQGYTPDITVLGHSQGGLAISNLPRGRYDRVVLMSSYVQADWTKKRRFSWDKPVLAISGTYDPLSPPERIAYDSYLLSSAYPLITVLLEGVNHSHFANGRKARGDRSSPLSTEDALGAIGTVIAAFVDDDLQSLESEPALILSKALIAGYRKSFERDEGACRAAQLGHLGVEEADGLEIQVKAYAEKRFYPQFILDKSYLQQDAGKTLIGIYQFTEHRISPVDVAPLQAITPEVIACKLRSAAAVSAATGVSYRGRTCAEENLAIVRQSFEVLPFLRQERLRQRGIDPLLEVERVQDDGSGETLKGQGIEIVGNYRARGEQWALGSFFKAAVDTDGIKIQTASVTTPLGTSKSPFLGAYYCKLIAPSRAYQLLDEASR